MTAPLPAHRPRPGRRHRNAVMSGGQRLFAICFCAFLAALVMMVVLVP